MEKRSSKDYWLVGIQFALFFIFLYSTNHHFGIAFWLKIVGLFVSVFGIFIVLVALFNLDKSLTAFPTPKNGSSLITTGLYKFARHPIYSGILFTVFGYSVFSDSIFRFCISILLLVLFLIKTNYEEKKLLSKYKEYQEYRNKVGRFLPKF